MLVQDNIPLSLLKELLSYDPESGDFRWKVTVNAKSTAGSIAGSAKQNKYIVIRIFCATYYAHRLAWYYTTGEWPLCGIDHANGNGLDNRVSNLRLATQAENMQNIRKRKSCTSSKYIGVSYNKQTMKWKSNINVNGKQVFLGSFTTEEDAHNAYCDAKKRLHNYNPCLRNGAGVS